MNHFFAYLFKTKYIKRWGLMRNTQEENIKEHSFDVALLAHGLAVITNVYFDGNVDVEKVMALGLLHEVGEIFTGDMPTPIKYYSPKIREAYDEVEEIAMEKIIAMLPEEMRKIYAPLLMQEDEALYLYVKMADKLSAYIKCVEELKSGNREFEKAKIKIGEELVQMDHPALQYFMQHFLPSYGLTLDELN